MTTSDATLPTAVRLSGEERAILREAAKAAGMPMTTYIRVAALEKARRDAKGKAK